MDLKISIFLLAVILLSFLSVSAQTQYGYLLTAALARIIQQQEQNACEVRLTTIRENGRINLETALRNAKQSAQQNLEACQLQTKQALENINCTENTTMAVNEALTTANQTLTANLEECNQTCANLTVTKVNEAIASVSTEDFDNCVHNFCDSPATVTDQPGCRLCATLNQTDCDSNSSCQFFNVPGICAAAPV